MGAGKLKMWKADRGFGFIADDAGGPDMFLHINDLKNAGIDPDQIKVGDPVHVRRRQHSRREDESQQRSARVSSG